MVFEVENIVLIGSFNPAIIRAEWLKEQKIYDKPIKLGFNISNGNLVLNFEDIHIISEINQNRIQISSSNLSENLNLKRLSFIVELFRKLQYTPLIAIGYNLRLKSSDKLANKINSTMDSLKTSNLLSFNISEKYKWDSYIVLCNIEKDIKTNIISTIFNFEIKNNSKNIYTFIEDFLKDLNKMRNYAVDNC